MTIAVLAGYGLIIAGIVVLGAIFWKTRNNITVTGVAGDRPAVKATDLLSAHAERPAALEVIERQQTVRMLGETNERAVQATIALSAMTQTNGQWHKSGVEYRALELAGGIWIFKVPSLEGGEPMWVKAAKLDTNMKLESFFKGSDAKPGPARLFRNNGQTEPIPFKLPASFKDNTDYEVVDIGRFATTVDGEDDTFRDGDQYPFVISRKRDKQGILIYLDVRRDLARGTGGTFHGEVFEPDVDIASIL